MSMSINVSLEMGHHKCSGLWCFFLKRIPQERQDRPWLYRGVLDDYGYRSLRLLCSNFLCQASQFEEISQQDVAEGIKRWSKCHS
jgi:hypothetical protein